jgi:penicillin-binding protein 1A
VGISPELVIGTWVGGENTWIRFLTRFNGYGGQMARPYYLNLMKDLEDDPSIQLNKGAAFKIPDGELLEMDCDVYNQPLPSKVEADKAKLEKVLSQPGFEDEFEGN